MSERYSRLFSLTENLYAEGSPVIVAAGALLKDNQTGKVLAQLKFTSIQEKQIKALKVKIYPKDTVGNALGEPMEYQYLDLTAKRDNDFASNVPIILSDAATRSYDVEVTEVIFTDNSIWQTENKPWEKLPNKQMILDGIKDYELRRQYSMEFGESRKYVYSEVKNLWYCACGAVNKKGEHTCHSCKISAEALTNMDLLKENCEKRLAKEAEQRKIAAEKAAEEARQMEIQAKKNKKTMKIAAIIALIFVAAAAFAAVLTIVIIPSIKYNSALSLMEEQRYEEAIAAFEALEGYKDSTEQINNCKIGILGREYNKAIALMESEKYDEAIIAFTELEDYKDSKEQIQNCEDAIVELENETKYNEAVALMDAGQYEKAMVAFKSLAEYKDSYDKIQACKNAITEKTNETKYKNAIALMEEQKYEEAIEKFEAIGDYKDSTEMAKSIFDEYIGKELKTANVGDSILFGKYRQDYFGSGNGKEKIEWLVLDKKDGKILVISKYALACQKYDSDKTETTWEACSLREWLNGSFSNDAFGNTEKAMIQETTIQADTGSGSATQDKVFLLSIAEVNKYFSSNSARRCKATEYAEMQSVYVSDPYGGNCWWWLRNSGKTQYYAAFVDGNGKVDTLGYNVDNTHLGVRPAMWIEIGE